MRLKLKGNRWRLKRKVSHRETLRRRGFAFRLLASATKAALFGRGTVNFKSMSQHRSLRAASTAGAKRNVLKRFERVEILKKRGLWKPGDRVTGLRKTKGEP
jgi:small basic protein (TIGR04137 family)